MLSFLNLRATRGRRDGGGALRQEVAGFVFRVPIVAAHPGPTDLVDLRSLIRFRPKNLVLLPLPTECHNLDE